MPIRPDAVRSRRAQRMSENERRLALARLQIAIRERMATQRKRFGTSIARRDPPSP